MKDRIGSLAIAALAALNLTAADITWRGGFGNNFGTIQNWQLPPGETEESARRLPGPNDRAIISEPGTVRVTSATLLNGLQFTGGGAGSGGSPECRRQCQRTDLNHQRSASG